MRNSDCFTFVLAPISRIFASVLAILVFTACAGKRAPILPAPTGPVTVGVITLVNEELGFVLIDSSLSVEPGTALHALSETSEETALLKVSAEKKPPFMIADVVKGTPHPGDRVKL